MSSREEFYTTQHTDIIYDTFIRDNPVVVRAVVTVDKTGDIEDIDIENVYLKSNKSRDGNELLSHDTTKIELNIDGLGSWNIDLDKGEGVYKDVAQQLEGEAYDKYMATR
tara:strand:- start:166 stop:495 length:330 start_codon:yes stop_codon:yes gene_type:complete